MKDILISLTKDEGMREGIKWWIWVCLHWKNALASYWTW